MTKKNMIRSEDQASYVLVVPGMMLEANCLEAEEVILDRAREILFARITRGAVLTSSRETKDYFRALLAPIKREVFQVAFLDSQHRLIACERLFEGTLDGSMVHPREVARSALHHNASAVIFVHNHPSGNPEPSQADIGITKKLKDALSLFEVRVLDHLIVGYEGVVSMAERGLV